MYDWNALALFGVVGLGMATSVGLIVHSLLGVFRGRKRDAGDQAAACC